MDKSHSVDKTSSIRPMPSHQVSVSIVVATRDRPTDLHQCLKCLTTQVTTRHVEIIVVDNNPDSGLTFPVVAQFPSVRLISETRSGVSYARNAGIISSCGDIVVTVDDDVTMPPDWLEKLLVHFARPEVFIVTGNVLPLETMTPAARLFETYGGLGRGEKLFEVNQRWFNRFRFRAVPTWELGGTANAAFRSSGFGDPSMGMMEETLGPGMPTGVGEDTYLFYRWLKAGAILVYEPSAFVWHKHRAELRALRHQIYNYSKGHVAYHLVTLIGDGDLRALIRLAFGLPMTHLARIVRRLPRRSKHPLLRLTLIEIAGNLVGPWSLWQAYRSVKREGRCALHVATLKGRLSQTATQPQQGQI